MAQCVASVDTEVRARAQSQLQQYNVLLQRHLFTGVTVGPPMKLGAMSSAGQSIHLQQFHLATQGQKVDNQPINQLTDYLYANQLIKRPTKKLINQLI